ncbi:uncharacterized protein SOCEGT47_062160 [Sorangium cellulosum]|uniref:Uncharacterized protein n=1 Tax=Sorangium cellulosum TaxID=56 RepID=A0A4P2Q7Z7_SORCE|nr:hypothetical protein [Sorangium cellulosum]AUX25667.1 uncharacterized protein SOCEGT47_062160 [Sorangium cellulosum]
MIRVQRAAEPPNFDVKVRQKGKAALAELIGSAEAPRRRGPPRKKRAGRIEDIPSEARYHDLYLGLKTDPDDPDEPLPLAWIRRHCPFMAHELERQGRLRPADRESTR